MSFIHVSIAAVTAEPEQFFVCFRLVSFEGNACFRQHIFVIVLAETRRNAMETSLFLCFRQRN